MDLSRTVSKSCASILLPWIGGGVDAGYHFAVLQKLNLGATQIKGS